MDEVGAAYEVDQEARRRDVIRLEIRWQHEDTLLRLRAEYPDLFPYFRVEVMAPDLSLLRHQNPLAHNLCLIDRDTRNWRVSQTIGLYLNEQLDKVLRAATSDDANEVADLEEHQGEPISAYFPCYAGAHVLIDGSWQIPEEGSGHLLMGHDPGRFETGLHGAVLEVRDDHDRVIAQADPAMWTRYPVHLVGAWIAMNAAPLAGSPKEVLALMRQSGHVPPRNRVGQHEVTVVAAVFPEEVVWRQFLSGWIFVVTCT